MPTIIDKTRDKQTQIKSILTGANARIDKLLLKIQTLSSPNQTKLERILNKQREQVLANQLELGANDITKSNVNTYRATKTTNNMIEKLSQINQSLKKIEEKIDSLLTPSKTATTIQRSENKEPNRATSSPSYAVPKGYQEPSAEEMEELFSTPKQGTDYTANWPKAPTNTQLKERNTPPQVSKQQKTITGENFPKTARNYAQERQLLETGKKLLEKEPEITNRYKRELEKMQHSISKAEGVLDQFDAASKAFANQGTKSNKENKEADALIQEALNQQRPKTPGS